VDRRDEEDDEMTPPWRSLGLVVAAAWLHSATPAHAQPAKPAPREVEAPGVDAESVESTPWSRGVSLEDRRAARELLLEGNRLFRVPLFARAAVEYRAAIAKWPHPAFYFNLALAQLNLGEEVDARENLEHALEHGEQVLDDEQLLEARDQLRALERQLGRVKITCATRSAEVVMDGKTILLGPGTFQGWVKPGSHEISTRRSGYLAEDRRVEISAGELETI
jgi:tetratricopeptide (TPR) repeat protein